MANNAQRFASLANKRITNIKNKLMANNVPILSGLANRLIYEFVNKLMANDVPMKSGLANITKHTKLRITYELYENFV